jgi:hypothetical protein
MRIIKSAADWARYAAKDPLAGEELKVMRRIDHRAIAVEAVLTRHGITNEAEAFYLRIMAPGDYRYRGGDLGALVTRGRLQTDNNHLAGRCKDWIAGIRAQFAGTPLGREASGPATQPAFKMA